MSETDTAAASHCWTVCSKDSALVGSDVTATVISLWTVAAALCVVSAPRLNVGAKVAALLQAAVGPDGKPLLGRISSKVGGLLEELNDMLGAFEGTPAGEGER